MTTCNGINCTSDGLTPHSAECVAEYERTVIGKDNPEALLATLLLCESRSGALTQEQHDICYAHIVALQADAQRYRGLRLLICEPDEAMRERMLKAVDKLMEAQPEQSPTPQCIDELFDQMILTAAGARNG